MPEAGQSPECAPESSEQRWWQETWTLVEELRDLQSAQEKIGWVTIAVTKIHKRAVKWHRDWVCLQFWKMELWSTKLGVKNENSL